MRLQQSPGALFWAPVDASLLFLESLQAQEEQAVLRGKVE